MTLAQALLIPDEPVTPAPTTARAMMEMLRRHYVPDDTKPAGVFAAEIQAPGPVGRRADAVWLGCTAAAGTELVGHEIKVTRADVLSELADLSKSDPWQRYCDRWYLVVPHLGLIDGLDLPESWGVMLPPSGRRTRSATVHRKAPRLEPREQTPALRTLAAWQLWKSRDLEIRAQRDADHVRELEIENQKLRLQNRSMPGYEVVAGIAAALGGVTRDDNGDSIGDWRHRVKPDDVVAALRDLGSLYERRDQAQHKLDSTKRGLASMRRGIDRLLTGAPDLVGELR